MLAVMICLCALNAGDWPQFRGPNSNGHVVGPATPMEWSDTKNVAWKVSVPGLGWSSPVIVDGKVFVTTAVPRGEGLSLRAMALDAKTGQTIWDREVRAVENPTCFRNIVLSLCLAMVAIHVETNVLGQQMLGFLRTDRILFLGNSAYQSDIPLNGPVGHPSDAGMKLIADTLFAAIFKKADIVELSAAHVAVVNRRRRIYVNNDVGYDSVAMGPKLTAIKPEEWIAARFSAFDQPGSQVDCVGWCLDEGNIAAYPSKILPELQYPTLLRWRKDGVDIAQRIVEESHQRKLEVFWEHRLNGADREADVNTPARHPLKDQHPEWLIAGSWWKPGLWNFAIPEVRKYKVAALREVAERYDLDGLNLDFGRHPPFLPTGQQWEHREALTDFVRQVRLMLQEVAERRGRPFLLSVRVADTVPGCHFDGMDVETWVRENLIDLIIIGTRSIQVDLPGFKRLTAGSHVKLYPCIDQHHSPDGYHAVPAPQFLRGVAANWLHQGADGVATFNFWNELPESGKVIGSSGPMAAGQSVHAIAYREMGDPELLALLDKSFVVSRRYGGGFYDRLGNRWDDYTNLNHQAPLPQMLAADPAWVEVYVADAIAAHADQVERLELRLLFSAVIDAKHVRVKFNGIELPTPTKEGTWWIFALTPRQAVAGRNLLTLDGSNIVGLKEPISLEKVEVHVRYRPEKFGK